MLEIKLDAIVIDSIKGDFFVPSYQRGYRWGIDEVKRLLNDIYDNGTSNYCLQPIVVKPKNGKYELIDGQQRLTTLFILLKYIQKEFKPRIKIKFHITYEIHEELESYLNNINPELAEEDINFFHVYQAYKTIDEWFKKQDNDVYVADKIYSYLVENVKIIWYQVDESEDSIELFERLNIGKIPLTSAELVKAMLLNKENNKKRKEQEEISLRWDNIEKELHNASLWFFLTNKKPEQYSTRIDLILDLISDKPEDTREKYYTFFYFDELRKQQSLDSIWKNISKTFFILKEWHEKHEMYHKIGYLIATGKTLKEIFNLFNGKRKTEFLKLLDNLIKETIKCDKNYGSLSYEKANEYQKISKLLLLFNVESVRRNGEQTQWFPFDKLKNSGVDKANWSLEHIHAQQSEGMKTQVEWKEWLYLHKKSLQSFSGNEPKEVIEAIDSILNKEKLERMEFEVIQEQVIELLSVKGSIEYMHSISNLALLNTADNTALNNSTFDVKRNEIIKRDKEGKFIPFCTKNVFLKYYTPSSENQLHFWGQADRLAYIAEINKVLKDYLSEKIIIEMEKI